MLPSLFINFTPASLNDFVEGVTGGGVPRLCCLELARLADSGSARELTFIFVLLLEK